MNSSIKEIQVPEEESTPRKQGIGFGKRYGTLNPLVILARKIAAKYDHEQYLADHDFFITSWMSTRSRPHLLGFPAHDLKEGTFWDWLFWDVLKTLSDFKKDCEYRFFRRMHKLTIQNVPSHTWIDPDERMFHACFSILGEFVEKELGPVKLNSPDYRMDCQYRGYRLHSYGDESAIDMWCWYKWDLPKEIEAHDNWLDRKYANCRPIISEGSFSFTPAQEQPDDEKYETDGMQKDYIEALKDKKLRELIDMRRSLWT